MKIRKFFGMRKENTLTSMKVKRFVLAKSMLRSRHRARLGACFCSVKAFNMLLRKVRLGIFAFFNWQPSCHATPSIIFKSICHFRHTLKKSRDEDAHFLPASGQQGAGWVWHKLIYLLKKMLFLGSVTAPFIHWAGWPVRVEVGRTIRALGYHLCRE